MNINHILPSLSIKAKLTFAFAALAVVPTATVTVLAGRHSVRQLRALAEATLESDLAIARAEAERTLLEVERDVAFLAHDVFGPLLPAASLEDWRTTSEAVGRFLSYKATLFQIKVTDAQGAILAMARAGEDSNLLSQQRPGAGLYYALRAEDVGPGERLLLPVEVRNTPHDSSAPGTVPAVAIIIPIVDAEGERIGVVIGEAHASELFEALDEATPLGGVTALVDSTGLYLYHSQWKRDWASLLASRTDVDLRNELTDDVANALLAGGTTTTLRMADEDIVSFTPLGFTRSERPLILYRVVPLSELEAGVRAFLSWVTLGSGVLLLGVIGLASVAAHQLTRPIYELRRGARRLAEGRMEEPLKISTNDELEDLAAEFSAMATSLADQRRMLEELVEERTHELRKAHEELAGIVQNSTDAIVGLDAEHRIRVWNRGAETMFGYVASEVMGRDLDELVVPPGEIPQNDARFIRQQTDTYGQVTNYQTQRVDRSGTAFPVSVSQTAIRGQGRVPIGYSLILRDTRVQAELESHMRRSERLATTSVLTASLAHELGNPLAAITNRIEWIERKIRDHEAGDFLGSDIAVLSEHVERLDGVVRHLLSFARESPDEMGPLSLNDLVLRLVDLLKRTYVGGAIDLRHELDASLPALHGSEQALETVCVNLLMNALAATPASGTVIVKTGVVRQSRAVWLEVVDTGPGVPVELRRKIFEPFFTTKTRGQGTGLGLAVCRSIVEQHEGQIDVSTADTGGSCFRVTLPVRR